MPRHFHFAAGGSGLSEGDSSAEGIEEGATEQKVLGMGSCESIRLPELSAHLTPMTRFYFIFSVVVVAGAFTFFSLLFRAALLPPPPSRVPLPLSGLVGDCIQSCLSDVFACWTQRSQRCSALLAAFVKMLSDFRSLCCALL